ncbi:CHRD domain-containing protein [Hymenobacter tibetensis]|uniref:CHRD domain-containing protein n=1 Tax=Hymenobacter tibetensis TaxID=497967 RepID=A0ABY4D396_9BACT|nr:CHRD domain-containing protein [Hymenobacter tibetensis]UOG76771.1 CHRD domain-containing protein [Hymenobacter tibetensis]
MRKNITHLLTGLILLLASISSQADHLRAHLLLSARLDGAQEVPAVNTSALGVASFTLNATRDTLFMNATFNGLSGAITMAHLHNGRPGVAGPPVIDLFRFVRGSQLRGFLTGPTDLTPARLRALLAGQYYINIHTAANPNGEIRGQVQLESDIQYIAGLDGDQEVPPVSTDAFGIGIFTLSQDKTKLKFQATATDLSGPITMAHFHTGAFGTVGPPVVDLLPFVSGNTVSGEITPNAAFITALEAGNIYINFHTAANPNGEIRGQLFSEAGRYLNLDGRLDGAQVVPAVTTTARATMNLSLTPTLDTLYVNAVANGLSGPITGALFAIAPAGQPYTSTTVRYNLTPLVEGNILNAGLLVSPANVAALLRGDFNLMLTTAANPTGEIRGQAYRLAREGYTFSMNGSQERPTPNTSAGYGSGFVSMDRDQSNVHFNMVWGGLTGPVTVGHFHTGLINQSGGVVFDLAPFFNPTGGAAVSAEGFWQTTGNAAPNTAANFTARRALQFRRDSIYANIHTNMYPGGEIRGQVFRGARNLSVILSNGPSALVAETFGYYPNPFRDELTLSFESRASGTATVNVADLLGRTVATKSVLVRVGANQPRLELPGIAPGVYLVTVDIAGSRLVSRVVKE